ncbi:cytotoxic and regulatory T-cell molecule [Cololabis saira]|uniref:cytotoxic and regulatory T-cell molecule n=1 Tax=Cololabis saira TaxID=129043 RepID=UPI002AD384E0|nr:cytotoxic and regulatory T-cell molecule [Cololabis saira]
MWKCCRAEVLFYVTDMAVKQRLSVFLLLIQVSLAVWQHVTVMEGRTVFLTCPIINPHMTNVEWKNPEGYVMFFNSNKALNDKRYSITNLSQTKFSISISRVTLKDGGNYTCSHYDHHTSQKKVEVTVLGSPTMSVVKHDGKMVIKCTAEGNHHPPQISWKFDQQPEFLAQENVHREGNKYVSMGIIHLFPVKNQVTVKCLVRHPALHSRPLMNFMIIGRDTKVPVRTTSTPPTPVQPQASTGLLGTTGTPTRHDGTSPYFQPTRGTGTSLGQSAVTPSQNAFSKSVTTFSRRPSSPVTFTTRLPTTGGGTPEISEDTYNSTKTNITGAPGNSSVLVLLVTCLIVCLLVVVIFFAIKLRRAHVAWRKENEESAPSEESSKSKSSQDEKNPQSRRGIFNTAFTQYIVEKPAVITSDLNKSAVTPKESTTNDRGTSQSKTQTQTYSTCHVKETPL